MMPTQRWLASNFSNSETFLYPDITPEMTFPGCLSYDVLKN
jgi:hypothetical protein